MRDKDRNHRRCCMNCNAKYYEDYDNYDEYEEYDEYDGYEEITENEEYPEQIVQQGRVFRKTREDDFYVSYFCDEGWGFKEKKNNIPQERIDNLKASKIPDILPLLATIINYLYFKYIGLSEVSSSIGGWKGFLAACAYPVIMFILGLLYYFNEKDYFENVMSVKYEYGFKYSIFLFLGAVFLGIEFFKGADVIAVCDFLTVVIAVLTLFCSLVFDRYDLRFAIHVTIYCTFFAQVMFKCGTVVVTLIIAIVAVPLMLIMSRGENEDYDSYNQRMEALFSIDQ